MWIIFDLDDTLVDTTGTLTPFRLEKALRVMIEKGLFIKDFFKSRFQLWTLNQKAMSAEEALKIFFTLGRYEKKFLEIGLQEIYDAKLPKNFPIKALPNAVETLQTLKNHSLCIVSKGHEEIQLKKLEKAGIDRGIFCKIYAQNTKDKKPFYQKILLDEKLEPGQVVVVGDRIGRDLVPAKELGLHTIHMKWGRGLCYEGNEHVADFEISNLAEIKEILHHLELLTGIKV